MAWILPRVRVDETASAYGLLGAEVMSIHKILKCWESRQSITAPVVICQTTRVTASLCAEGPTGSPSAAAAKD